LKFDTRLFGLTRRLAIAKRRQDVRLERLVEPLKKICATTRLPPACAQVFTPHGGALGVGKGCNECIRIGPAPHCSNHLLRNGERLSDADPALDERTDAEGVR